MMRALLAGLLLVASTGQVRAQEQVPDGPDDERAVQPQPVQPQPMQPVQPRPQLVEPPPPRAAIVQPPNEEGLRLERTGKAMRAGGAVMLALGIALEIAGQGMVLYSQFADPPVCTVVGGKTSCPDDPREPVLIAGVVSGLAAGGLIYGGLALLSAGNGRIRRGKLMKLHMSFSNEQVSAQVGFTF